MRYFIEKNTFELTRLTEAVSEMHQWSERSDRQFMLDELSYLGDNLSPSSMLMVVKADRGLKRREIHRRRATRSSITLIPKSP